MSQRCAVGAARGKRLSARSEGLKDANQAREAFDDQSDPFEPS